jgi:hypothetical protein
MTPKEKAEELVDKFMDYTGFEINEQNNMSNIFSAKQCALIAVDYILKSNSNINIFICSKEVKYKNKAETEIKSDCKENLEYWKEVKQEIEKL